MIPTKKSSHQPTHHVFHIKDTKTPKTRNALKPIKRETYKASSLYENQSVLDNSFYEEIFVKYRNYNRGDDIKKSKKKYISKKTLFCELEKYDEIKDKQHINYQLDKKLESDKKNPNELTPPKVSLKETQKNIFMKMIKTPDQQALPLLKNESNNEANGFLNIFNKGLSNDNLEKPKKNLLKKIIQKRAEKNTNQKKDSDFPKIITNKSDQISQVVSNLLNLYYYIEFRF